MAKQNKERTSDDIRLPDFDLDLPTLNFLISFCEYERDNREGRLVKDAWDSAYEYLRELAALAAQKSNKPKQKRKTQ